MRRRTVRTLGLHGCDSGFKIFMRPSPRVYICIFLGVYLLYPCISLSRVQHQLFGWLMIFFFLSQFKRIFLIPAAHTERRRRAPLQQRGSFRHGVAQSDIFLHMLPSFSLSRGVQRRVETAAALWECFEHYRDLKNGWNSVKAHGDDGFLIARVMTSFKKCFTSILDISWRGSDCAGWRFCVFPGCRVSDF